MEDYKFLITMMNILFYSEYSILDKGEIKSLEIRLIKIKARDINHWMEL